MRQFLLAVLLCLIASAAFAGQVTNPSGSGDGGSGTVTSVTFTGDGTVLSSTPSSAVTTTGTLAATLKTQSANILIGTTAAGPAAALAVPSCSTSASALIWTSGTGFGCNTSVAAPAGSLTGSSLAAGITGSSLTSVGTLTNLTVTNPITGSVTGNAGTVTTNANLTGPITSSGNATSVAAQTGTGSTFVMSASPTFTGSPVLSTASATTLGVGTASPASTLSVNGGGLAVGIYASSNNSAVGIGSAVFSGNVGIGTAAPKNLLNVNGAASIGYNVAAPSNGLIVNGNVGIGTTTAIRALDMVGSVGVAVSGSGAGAALQGNGSVGELVGINLGNSTFNALQFTTGGSPSMYVGTSGTIGIGTTIPGAAVEIDSSQNFSLIINGTSTNETNVWMQSQGSPTFSIEAQSSSGGGQAFLSNRINGGSIQFRTMTSGGTFNTPMAILGTGNVYLENIPSGALASFYTCYDPSSSPVGELTYQATNCTTSLRATKHDIRTYNHGLADAMALHPSTFIMNNSSDGRKEIGLIAEDVESENADLAGYQDGKLRTVQYDRIGVVAIAAIQEQQKEIDGLREKLNMGPSKCNIFCRARRWFEDL